MSCKPLIIVLGYFYRHNLGDDIYMNIWQRFLIRYKNFDFSLINPDEIEYLPENTHLVLVGGGELFNDYYLMKIKILVSDRAVPVYAVSIGFPYPQIINDTSLNLFDYVITRNQGDLPILQEFIGSYGRWSPDLATLWPDLSAESETLNQTFCLNLTKRFERNEILEKYELNCTNKKIGVFLAGAFYSELNNGRSYKNILQKIAHIIISIINDQTCCSFNKGYKIYLMSFNTGDKRDESDLKINHDLYELLTEYHASIKFINRAIEIDDIMTVFESFDFTLCARFHAHIFSIMNSVPFISIASTRKVKQLLKDNQLTDLDFSLITDPQTLKPIDLPDLNKIKTQIKLIIKNRKNYSQRLFNVSENWFTHKQCLVNWLDNLIHSVPIRLRPHTKMFELIVSQKTNEISSLIIEQLNQNGANLIDIQSINCIVDLYESKNIDYDDHTAEFLARLISFVLLKKVESPYVHGLEEQVLTSSYNLSDSVAWILEHAQNVRMNNYVLDNQIKWTHRRFNLNYFDQDNFENLHRSGWFYVMNHLKNYHRTDGIIFDIYADKTFGWLRNFYLKFGLLPHTKPWMGIFHHTPETTFSSDNLSNFFNDPVLIESLNYCQKIIVLSDYVAQWIKNRLTELELHIEVISILHPTEICVQKFSWHKFLTNPEPKVIQIGAWLRDTYAIYDLPELDFLKKAALKGKAMENYYLDDHLLVNTYNQITVGSNIVMCRGVDIGNKHLVGLRKSLKKKMRSVNVLEYVNNDQFDQLLAENIVFIKLVDASAVNTVIECIVRATPIVVNRLPSLEEYLGSDYPLFYENLNQATQILNSYKKLKAGHQYLLKKDLSNFHIDKFMEKLLR